MVIDHLLFPATLPRFEEKSVFSESFLQHSVRKNWVQMVSKEIRNVRNLNLCVVPNIGGVANELSKAQSSTARSRWTEE